MHKDNLALAQEADNVIVCFTEAQWNLVFHVLNGLSTEEFNRAQRRATLRGENIGENPALTLSRALGQLINPGHPALFTNNGENKA